MESDYAKKIKAKLNASKSSNSVQLIMSKSELVEYNISLKKNKKSLLKEKVDDWENVDFFLYMSKKFSDMFSKKIELKKSGSCTQINNLRDDIMQIFGDCNNFILKEYFDFYIERFLFTVASSPSGFSFSEMKNKNCLKSFVSFCKNLIKPENESNKEVIVNKLSKKEVEASYLLNLERLVLDYGFIISVQWLIFYRKFDVKKSLTTVVMVLDKLNKKIDISNIISVTEKFSPYPDWFIFKNVDFFISRYGKNMSIYFVNNDEQLKEFSFLRCEK